MDKRLLFLAGLLTIYEAGPALAETAAVNDDAKKELAAMRQEMQQMRNAQKALEAKIEARIAAQVRAAQASRGAPPDQGAVVVKEANQSWLSRVQFPAPPGATAPNMLTVPQVARTSVTGITDTAAAAPALGNTLSARVLGVDVGFYGFVDLSFDRAHNGQQEWNQVSSNESFIGLAGGVNLGSPTLRAIYQIETMAEVSATPGVGSSIGSRNSFAGISSPYGSLMVGKYDTPYKRATALMNPFKGSIGDYNSIMGNTAGEGRAEFDYRMPHSIFYDSPNFHGFTVNALYSPGQKLEDLAASGNNAFPQGELVCSGSQQPSLNGATPNAMGTQTLCNDGAFQDAYSVAVNYEYGGLYLTGAYELHKSVNRQSDKGGLIANESALKGGASYHFFFGNQLSVIYEYLRREGIPAMGDERERGGVYISDVQDLGYNVDLMVAYAHAYNTPGSPKFPISADYANMYTAGLKYHINEHASLYLVAAYLQQGAGAHYGLGAGEGHGTPILSPRQWSGAPFPGQTIDGISSGVQISF